MKRKGEPFPAVVGRGRRRGSVTTTKRGGLYGIRATEDFHVMRIQNRGCAARLISQMKTQSVILGSMCFESTGGSTKPWAHRPNGVRAWLSDNGWTYLALGSIMIPRYMLYAKIKTPSPVLPELEPGTKRRTIPQPTLISSLLSPSCVSCLLKSDAPQRDSVMQKCRRDRPRATTLPLLTSLS